MVPKEIVSELDKFIIGQADAKRAVAVALRNRWRRYQVEQPMRDEIFPKNILMIGPTGVGKTEIARRLAKLCDAPFVKVEATKFTEVGFHGRDVDTIIDDLYRAATTHIRTKIWKKNEAVAHERAVTKVLELLTSAPPEQANVFREYLDRGEMADVTVKVEVLERPEPPPKYLGQEAAEEYQQRMRQARTVEKELPVPEAIKVLKNQEMERLLDSDEVKRLALKATEEDGIVVIDEIDKIVTGEGHYHGPTASAEGVQQDLLPLIEGTTVTTKKGLTIKTDRILFVASGAFHSVKPGDMLAELQGRLPIRVELQPLSEQDFYRILSEPEINLVRQHTEMLATEGIKLTVTEDALREMARVAFQANATVQNIGARRLITVIEKVLEQVSFDAPEMEPNTEVVIDAKVVKERISDLLGSEDIRKFIL